MIFLVTFTRACVHWLSWFCFYSSSFCFVPFPVLVVHFITAPVEKSSQFLFCRIKNVNLDKEKEDEIDLKKKEARKRKLMEKGKVSRQEKKRKKKMEVRHIRV